MSNIRSKCKHVWIISENQKDVGKIGIRKKCIKCSYEMTFVRDEELKRRGLDE